MKNSMNRVITIFNRKTSMRLTRIEWSILENICLREKLKRKKLFEMIETKRDNKLSFTAAVRLFSLLYLSIQADKVMGGYFPFSASPLEVNLVLDKLSQSLDDYG